MVKVNLALSAAAHSAGLSSPVWIIAPKNEDVRSHRLDVMNKLETCGDLCASFLSVQSRSTQGGLVLLL